MSILTYINLSNGLENWMIQADLLHEVPGKRPHMILTGESQLFTLGENDAEAMERTYTSGSILAPKPRYRGKDFTVDVAIYSKGEATVPVKTILQNFTTFLTSGNLSFTSDFPHALTVQTQRIDIISERWTGSGFVHLRLFFKAREP